MQLKFIPTWKIKEILSDPYTRGIDGQDYEPFREELQDILDDRLEKEYELEIKRSIKCYNK